MGWLAFLKGLPWRWVGAGIAVVALVATYLTIKQSWREDERQKIKEQND